jgi:hypothetical protein
MRCLIVIVFSLIPLMATAQASPSPTTESRDASLAYIGTANFVVGRVGRDCLTLLGRSETPQAFVAAWQQRNAKYLHASAKYMEVRLQEAQSTGGNERREAVLRALTGAVQSSAAQTVASWLGRGDKLDGCKRAVALIENGTYDFTSSSPMFGELESLVQWASQ